MSKKTKRELRREIAKLREERGENILIAYRDLATGEITDFDGNPIDPDNHGADKLLIFEESVVMGREKAEKEGRTIIGPYEDGPDGRDLVEVPCSSSPVRGGT